MTQDYYRPTHTFRSGAYNATQVRLYGIYNTEPLFITGSVLRIGDVEITVGKAPDHDGDGTPDPADYKTVINVFKFKVKSGNPVIITTLTTVPDADDDDQYGEDDTEEYRTIGIIYGYAYEGHCYDLPKPAVMLLPVRPRRIPDDDCGYDEKQAEGYRVWVVDKLDECQHIEVSSGFVEQLVLEANMPGKRSPSTYSATMQFAHRSGRMPE